eukprot:6201535-Pleurochrysis_carterae.AAC.2
MTAHAGKLGIPQGQVAGDRSNLIAWLKVLGPIIYGQLYVQGFKAGAPQLPFVLNVILMLVALSRPTAQRFSGCSQTCKVKPVHDAVFTTLPSAVHSVVQRRRVTLLLTRGNTISSKCKTQPTKYAHAGTSTTALSPGQWPARGRY